MSPFSGASLGIALNFSMLKHIINNILQKTLVDIVELEVRGLAVQLVWMLDAWSDLN